MAARYSTVLFALAALASVGAQAALFTGSDSNSGLVAEHPYLRHFTPGCIRTPCEIQRKLTVPAAGPIERVVLTVSLLQSPWVEYPDATAEAMFLSHGITEILLEPMTRAPLSGLPITITFDDAALVERPLLGFQESGAYRPNEPLSSFIGMDVAGPWILTVVEHHEGAGFTRYLDSSIQVWADPRPVVVLPPPVLSVPEPGTWAMMVAGLGLLMMAKRRYESL